MFAIIVYSSNVCILGMVIVLSHTFCVTFEFHHYGQLACFNILQQYKEADTFI